MAWAEDNGERIRSDTQLAVLDAGVYGFEISIFDFRRQEAEGVTFQVPVRRLDRLRALQTGNLLSDNFDAVSVSASKTRSLPVTHEPKLL
jgi:hypothetical protein